MGKSKAIKSRKDISSDENEESRESPSVEKKSLSNK